MTPDQLAQLLVGIARAQASMVRGMTAHLPEAEKMKALAGAQQSVGTAPLGQAGKPLTLETLPSRLLAVALAPASHAGRTIDATALAEVTRLLK